MNTDNIVSYFLVLFLFVLVAAVATPSDDDDAVTADALAACASLTWCTMWFDMLRSLAAALCASDSPALSPK